VRVLVAGVGNVLRRDDGFGVAVIDRLSRQGVAENVRVLDVGIGGIHLVQELHDGFDALIVVDAVDLGKPAGTLLTIRPEIEAPTGPDDLADTHYATPARAFMLANALGVLPQRVWVVGAQPEDADTLGDSLSDALERAVNPAVDEIRRLIAGLDP